MQQVVGVVKQPNVVRRTPNPLDRATIVSLLPKSVVETKSTLFPGKFEIPGAKPGEFELLVIGSASWFRMVDEDQPLLEVVVSSYELARSIVDDFCLGTFECNMVDCMPGLFFIPGSFTKLNIRTYKNEDGITFDQLLSSVKEKQRNWFSKLVMAADEHWARTNGNPRSIGDDSRFAAEVLNLKNKPWMQDFVAVQLHNCPSCGELINPAYPVCKHCHAIVDKVKAKELDIKFAIS